MKPYVNPSRKPMQMGGKALPKSTKRKKRSNGTPSGTSGERATSDMVKKGVVKPTAVRRAELQSLFNSGEKGKNQVRALAEGNNTDALIASLKVPPRSPQETKNEHQKIH